MTHPQQQPGDWSDPSWPAQQPYADPNQPASPGAGYPASPAGYPASPAGYPAGPAGYPETPAGYAIEAPAGYAGQAPGGYAGYPTSPAAQPYPTYGYGTPQVVMAPAQSTNGLAIAALVCALAGLATCGVTSIIGAILGHVSRKQIRERGEGGDGLALAGIVSGWIIFGLWVLFWVIYIAFFVWVFQTASNLPTIPDPTPS